MILEIAGYPTKIGKHERMQTQYLGRRLCRETASMLIPSSLSTDVSHRWRASSAWKLAALRSKVLVWSWASAPLSKSQISLVTEKLPGASSPCRLAVLGGHLNHEGWVGKNTPGRWAANPHISCSRNELCQKNLDWPLQPFLLGRLFPADGCSLLLLG